MKLHGVRLQILTLLKLVKHCHNSASWGDDVFIEKLIPAVVDLDSIMIG